MLRKFVVAFAILALAAAFAGTVPTHGPSYTITLMQSTQLKDATLTPGDYRLTIDNGKATFAQGKKVVTVDVRVENQAAKIDTTSLRFEEVAGKQTLKEIRIGGTKTKLFIE
jgi:hypothetical protein